MERLQRDLEIKKVKTCKTVVLCIPIADIFVCARNLVRRFGQKFTQRMHEENLAQLQDARTGTYVRKFQAFDGWIYDLTY